MCRPEDGNAGRHGCIITALQAIVAQHGRWGFWKCLDRLRALGHPWNHQRVYRAYCALRLKPLRRTKKRLPKREALPIAVDVSLPSVRVIAVLEQRCTN
jgi:hypothetical protein